MGVRLYLVKHYEMEIGEQLAEGYLEICTQSIEECEYDNELITILKRYAQLPYAQKTGFVRVEFI